MIILDIVGNIGAGKSTVLEHIAKTMTTSTCRILPEPIELWRSPIAEDETPLSCLYSDPHRHGFTFQMFAMQTRLQQQLSALSSEGRSSNAIFVVERYCASIKDVFIEDAFQQGVVDAFQYHTYAHLKQFARDLIHGKVEEVDHITIYLRTDPVKCMHRMLRRNRAEECQHVSLEYLTRLHDLHEASYCHHSSNHETQTWTIQVDDHEGGETLAPEQIAQQVLQHVSALYTV
jgi:deoxyadenosine/deoxycytidine kinase